MELLSNTSLVVATTDDSTVTLHCEMRAFIRPDSSLIWEGLGGQINTTGTEKYQITFSDGSPRAAANGGALLVPSQVSTLTITNPELSDADTYICTVMGTSESVTMQVMVNGTDISDTVTINRVDIADANTTSGTQINPTTSISNNATLQPVVITLSSMTAILTGLLVTTVIAMFLCLIHARNKLRIANTDTRSNPAVYDYVLTCHTHNDGAHHNEVQPDDELGSAATRSESDAIIAVERAYDEIIDDLSMDAYVEIKDNPNATEKIVNHGVALSTIVASEMNEDYAMATADGINISERSVNVGIGPDGIYDRLAIGSADVADSRMDQEKSEAYGDGILTLDSNVVYSEVEDNVPDTAMENNEAYGVADAAIVKSNVAYNMAIDGIGTDTMKRNEAYGAAVIHADSEEDDYAMVDDYEVSM